MAQNRYSGHTASFVHAGGTLSATQVKSLSVRPGSKKDTIIPAGNLDPSARILAMADPEVRLTTDDILTLMTTVSPSAGLACSGGATFRYQLRASGSTFAGATSHVTLVSTVGFLCPVSLGAEQDSPALLELMYKPHFDGTNLPLVPNASQSISTTPAFNSEYYLGPAYVNGVLLDSIIGHSVDFGIRYETYRESGDIYAKVGSIITRNPSISLKCKNVDLANTIGNLFQAALAGTIALYYRRGSNGSSRVADGTGSHAKISAASGSWSHDDISWSDNDDGTSTITVMPTSAISGSVASTIP